MADRPAKPDRNEPLGLQHGSGDASWAPVPRTFRSVSSSLPQPWEDVFGPLREGAIDDLVLVGQCGQSIDARIATSSGQSHYINGEPGLIHLHRLRALVDAVVIGVGTAIADDPQLTVRLTPEQRQYERAPRQGPLRVVLATNGQLAPQLHLLQPELANGTCVIVGETCPTEQSERTRTCG